ncbi:uncharacterized protein LOC118205287, partial [Stegodyphus dumicola]|uniref:uncharacterized protein LOC118205287 n=1 Tax=Stegodyphus dumicola TaxID=202533 RepID=UPI0015ADCCF4
FALVRWMKYSEDMDLVSGYSSDASENDNVKFPRKKNRNSTYNIEVICIDDSDSEEQNVGENRNLPSISNKNTEKSCDESKSLPSVITVKNEVDECSQSNACAKNVVNLVIEKPSSAEKIDFLNLDGSDTEDAQELIQNKIISLLNSAAILKDECFAPQNANISTDQSGRVSVECNQQMETNKRENPSDSPCENVHKRQKCEFQDPDFKGKDTDIVSSSDASISSTHIYRKDERVNDAYIKNIVCRIPHQIIQTFTGHTNTVTSLNWCIPQYSHLLLSASADGTLKIWDIFCKNPVRCFKNNLGLKAAKWSLDGEQVLTGGYGKKAHVFDVLSGMEIAAYDVYNFVTSMEIHPYMDDLFVCGTRNAILGFDLRVNSSLPIRTFFTKGEDVLDIAFLDENEFICSNAIVTRDSADRTIMVWDFSSGAILSNQIYLERYTCPSLKIHPYDGSFVAQTNGDYIAAFSTRRPYKIKNKRYMGHK